MEFEVVKGYDDGVPNMRAFELDPRRDPQGNRIEWPAGTTCIVGRDEDNEVVAFGAILVLPHMEGVWVNPRVRGTGVAPHLVQKIEAMLQEQGGTAVFAFAHDFDPQIKSYLEKFHYQRMPFTVYMKELKAQ